MTTTNDHASDFAISFGDGVDDALLKCLAAIGEEWVVQVHLTDGTFLDVETIGFDEERSVLFGFEFDADEGAANFTAPVAYHLTSIQRIHIY